ncbi:MAG: efflux RND transporter periplasmic adaptor subunit [Clostridium sp.]
MNKKVVITIGAVVLAGVITAGVYFLGGSKSGASNGEGVYVDSVSMITGMGGIGLQNRFSGVVEPQETLEIKLDSGKTVKECYVEEGQEVAIGTELFLYDTGEMAIKLEEGKLELESISNEILSMNRQISTLETEKANASDDGKLEYTIQIQNLQNSVKRAEYNKTVKDLELTQLQKSIDTAKVTSNIQGVVKAINKTGMDQSGQPVAYMTILATGEYRIKATTNEQNVFALTEGMPVIARSRVDSSLTWNGTINKIDTESPVDNNNQNGGMMGPGGGNVETATKYHFYTTLDSYDGLMLGQHVFVEIDNGQGTAKEGLWIPSYYLVEMEGEKAFVWTANDKDKLEKKAVTLGEYDAEMDQYQIVEGITPEDYIAFPQEDLKEGTKVIKGGEEIMK